MSVVLIVEDEQHLAEGLKFNLEAEGYEVETVGDGETAIELLTQSNDDVSGRTQSFAIPPFCGPLLAP